jgi:hypothetical protein
MRIQVTSIPDFTSHLLMDGASTHLKRVYRDITYTPLQGLSLTVTFHLTAILQFPDGSESFLEYNKHCGIDRKSKPISSEGTDFAFNLLAELYDALEGKGYAIVPGIIDMS